MPHKVAKVVKKVIKKVSKKGVAHHKAIGNGHRLREVANKLRDWVVKKRARIQDMIKYLAKLIKNLVTNNRKQTRKANVQTATLLAALIKRLDAGQATLANELRVINYFKKQAEMRN